LPATRTLSPSRPAKRRAETRPNASFGIANTSGMLQCVPLPPRMVGITLGYKF
jgi:hypothetical protein